MQNKKFNEAQSFYMRYLNKYTINPFLKAFMNASIIYTDFLTRPVKEIIDEDLDDIKELHCSLKNFFSEYEKAIDNCNTHVVIIYSNYMNLIDIFDNPDSYRFCKGFDGIDEALNNMLKEVDAKAYEIFVYNIQRDKIEVGTLVSKVTYRFEKATIY